MPATHIADNIQEIQARIATAAAASDRTPESVNLVAVSKTFPVEILTQAIAAGQFRLGENRIQEAAPKIAHFRDIQRVEWHLVGHLQSNKARQAVELFDVIHSIDSIKLATRLSRAGLETGRRPSVLLQLDLGQEATKFGIEPGRVRDVVAAVRELEGIRLNGFMTLPPFFEDPQQVRPYFSRLRELLLELEAEQPGCLGERHLSMGMSHDFEVAIEEGATMVRVGTGIFGARPRG